MNFEFRMLKWLLPFVLVLPAQAATFVATNIYSVAKDQVVAEELWIATGEAETEGTFKNDLFISSGGPLALNGSYEGNVWGAAGGGATVSGHCERNVRLAGKSVRIDGPIDGNVMAIAETIIATTNAVIGGNVRLIGTSIILEGSIGGNVSITAARVATLGGTIGGDTKVTSSDVLFSRDAKLQGNLSYTANKELVPSEGIVSGKLERIVPQVPSAFSKERLTTHFMWFLAAIFAGVPFVAFLPMSSALAVQMARKSPLKCLLVGFFSSIALPLIGLMCASSLIGIPLGALILASWGILFYLGRIVMGLMLGTLILRLGNTSFSRILLTLAVGLAVIYFAALIPIIGVPLQMTVVWMGMGSLILGMIQKRRMIIQAPKNGLEQLKKLRDEKYNPEEK